MQYAIKTGGYAAQCDYVWKNVDVSEFDLIVKVMDSVKFGEQHNGIVLWRRNGKFHIYIVNLNKLGENDNPRDVANRVIYVNVLFSDLSQNETEKIIGYYMRNWNSNIGQHFTEIVLWLNESTWEPKKTAIEKAFQRIQQEPESGFEKLFTSFFDNPDDVQFCVENGQFKDIQKYLQPRSVSRSQTGWWRTLWVTLIFCLVVVIVFLSMERDGDWVTINELKEQIYALEDDVWKKQMKIDEAKYEYETTADDLERIREEQNELENRLEITKEEYEKELDKKRLEIAELTQKQFSAFDGEQQRKLFMNWFEQQNVTIQGTLLRIHHSNQEMEKPNL